MSGCIYLTDLDDTLFRSLAKHSEQAGLTRVTTATNGHHGHMDAAQRRVFAALRSTGHVIPVTARSSDAFARVHLDFGTGRAVLANGAVVRDETGRLDPDWSDHTCRIGHRFEPLFGEMSAIVRTEFGEAARSWVVMEEGAPVYFCVKMNTAEDLAVRDGITAARDLLTGRLDLSGMWSHANGNNLSFTPIGISKRDACLHLIGQLRDRGDAPLIGLGDSLTDLPFMGLCDFMMMPSRSQIATRFFWAEEDG
jgi:hydroxymethylpyrimidine pyrophosphatase-like HAD family hydrolase